MPRNKPTKVQNAGVVIASSVRSAGTFLGEGSTELAKDAKDGVVYVAKGSGFLAKRIAVAVAEVASDFGKGLKKGWERG